MSEHFYGFKPTECSPSAIPHVFFYFMWLYNSRDIFKNNRSLFWFIWGFCFYGIKWVRANSLRGTGKRGWGGREKRDRPLRRNSICNDAFYAVINERWATKLLLLIYFSAGLWNEMIDSVADERFASGLLDKRGKSPLT